MLAALLLSASAVAEPLSGARSATLEPCHAKGLSDRMLCGRIEQPLSTDSNASDQGSISIHFAVLPAIKPVYPHEAVLAFAGGPGQSAFDAAASFEHSLRYARETRDIVLVDQRGTGRSGLLQCDSMDLVTQFALDETSIDMAALIRSEMKTCQQQLQVDLQHYTTQAAASDFEAVRIALGYHKLHLYGGSYGTRMAQEYMRQYPEAVLSATLDGVVPFQQSFAAMGLASDASLAALYRDCETSTACSKSFPAASQQLQQLITQLEQAPIHTQVRHPRTFERIELTLTRSKLQQALRFGLYSNSTRALIPLAVEKASQGDYSALVGLMLAQDMVTDLSVGVNTAVVCAEDWPFWTEENRAYYSGSYLGHEWMEAVDNICPIWQLTPVAADFLQPLSTDIPVLLLSGGLDPVTPPEGAELAMAEMRHAKHLIAPEATHIVASQSRCAPKLISQFISEQSVEALDGSCLEQPLRQPFLTNANGIAMPTAPASTQPQSQE
ncbi:alpha/beta hydrolase [Alkalimonas delamerensis]|uniref:Alpha/beta hydrolase n=1 Tax=Alkalimonas delamerensis TaxID=265981 RepID=A0ABT9GTQ9_9GAMM|nr:alpha/beta hydrolase [Alkalimonas delamerensis]MDP4530170.1 alpha/beta hydrolase [Alkalimonas delamerensis]